MTERFARPNISQLRFDRSTDLMQFKNVKDGFRGFKVVKKRSGVDCWKVLQSLYQRFSRTRSTYLVIFTTLPDNPSTTAAYIRTITLRYPTNPFTILEPQDQEISSFCVVQGLILKLQNCERVCWVVFTGRWCDCFKQFMERLSRGNCCFILVETTHRTFRGF